METAADAHAVAQHRVGFDEVDEFVPREAVTPATVFADRSFVLKAVYPSGERFQFRTVVLPIEGERLVHAPRPACVRVLLGFVINSDGDSRNEGLPAVHDGRESVLPVNHQGLAQPVRARVAVLLGYR
ncbi:hypothetical protein LXH09_36035 [Streptomyces sp. CS7]|uniref:hypothetical protein n=1 Tax=Streptomyces sp. CS-7 TaxID=2906769 RepID=UPI0021B3938C|nr:hypothetical protein [Streptomyces sp. CS-7]MCT6782040.1 hypothetical protein [Streptomyces sp. CS-7]